MKIEVERRIEQTNIKLQLLRHQYLCNTNANSCVLAKFTSDLEKSSIHEMLIDQYIRIESEGAWATSSTMVNEESNQEVNALVGSS